MIGTVKKIIKIYKNAFDCLGPQDSWWGCTYPLLMIFGIPFSALVLASSVLAYFNFPVMKLNGEVITGVPALVNGLGTAFIFVPVLCVLVGSAMWLQNRFSPSRWFF